MSVGDDPALDAGEWLFRRRGEVFGPVASRALAGMLYRGELAPETPVSAGDGRWAPVAEVPLFLLHVRRAEAALRVQAEVTGARKLRARRSRVRLALFAVAVALVGAAGVALWLRPALELLLLGRGAASARLEDFGQGISIARPTRVGVSARSAPGGDEIAVAFEPAPSSSAAAPHGTERRERPTAPRAEAAGGPADGPAVASQFDAGRIQAVVSREQRSLAACFQAEASRSTELRGEVPIEFAIGNDGRVTALWIDDPRFREGALRECLTRALSAWRFDRFAGERPTVQLAFRVGR